MQRTSFVVGLLLAGLAAPLAPSPASAQDAPSGKQRVYIGTYASPKSRGIYRCDLDLATGKLSQPELAGEAVNPSFLAIHPTKRFLYAVSEVSMLDGKKTGGVAAFAIDSATGDLQKLNIQPCGGTGPCHINVDKAGQHALVANYGGGSAAVLPIGADGKLAEMSGFAQHTGTNPHTERPLSPRAHSINLDAANHYAFVCDAGLDKVFVYRYDAEKGTLTPNDPPAGIVPPRAAPRHFAFHPSGKWAYAINEAALSVTVFNYDAEKGTLTPVQTISTLPAGTETKGLSTAEVVVHPTGKFLYGSNRGHNSIAGFTIDQQTGQLTATGHFARDVKVPRNFNIDPTGAYALVAGQDGDNIVVFKINATTGAFEPTGHSVEVGKPVCVRFVQL